MPGAVQFAVGAHAGVGGGVTAEAFALNLARAGDSRSNCRGAFIQTRVGSYPKLLYLRS